MTLDTHGRHLLVEYWGCDGEALNDLAGVEALMKRAAVDAGATIVASVFHPFTPQGVSGVVVVEESHLSIHTWPETGYAAVDFYTCGDCQPRRAHETLKQGFRPRKSEIIEVDRGIGPGGTSMRLDEHVVERAESKAGAPTRAGDERAEEPARPERPVDEARRLTAVA